MRTQISNSEKPWQTPWPDKGLEHIGVCPICESADRNVLHKKVVDNVFFCAPGTWTLWGCLSCGVAYLDPRPSVQTIHLAYSNYYTHIKSSDQSAYVHHGGLRKIVRSIISHYANWRYSNKEQPSFSFGVLAAYIFPPLKKIVDHKYRHLCRLPLSGGKLLDVGCGNGSFLQLARTCGWDAVGLDPDPKSVSNALGQGLTAYEGGIEYFSGKKELFDVITLNHVIEHVHDPIMVLKAAYTLLKPGGQLWLETPNIDSFGHGFFQTNWRGIETPRHLVIFNRHGISRAFAAAGFDPPLDRDRPSACPGMLKSSLAIKHGSLFSGKQRLTLKLKFLVMIAMIVERFNPARREFLTVTVSKRTAEVSKK